MGVATVFRCECLPQVGAGGRSLSEDESGLLVPFLSLGLDEWWGWIPPRLSTWPPSEPLPLRCRHIGDDGLVNQGVDAVTGAGVGAPPIFDQLDPLLGLLSWQ